MSYFDHEEIPDYGFELPDRRWYMMDKRGKEIAVNIRRDFHDEGYTCSFFVTEDGREVCSLPHHVNEDMAISIARSMYEEDRKLTRAYYEDDRTVAAERRLGA